MIASACIAGPFDPRVFVDEQDVPEVAEEILEQLRQQSRKAEMERLAAKLNG